MAEQRKYMFDMDFSPGAMARSAEKSAMDDADAELERLVEPEPPAPMFSEDDLMVARDGAYQEGRTIGFQEGQISAQKHLADAIDRLTQSLPAISQAQAAANEMIVKDAIKVAMAAMQKAMPATAAKYGFHEVEKVVADMVPHLLDEPRLIVRVASPLVDVMRERLDQVATLTGFEGRMVVQEDPRIGPSDCKVEWADGGAERDLARLLAEMDQVVDRALAAMHDADGMTAE